jgi:hypothetical protein
MVLQRLQVMKELIRLSTVKPGIPDFRFRCRAPAIAPVSAQAAEFVGAAARETGGCYRGARSREPVFFD